MKYVATVLAGCVLTLGFDTGAIAHCEVPCGIYGDQARFEAMLEDQTTVKKAMAQINIAAGKDGAQQINQMTRWIANKEKHASSIQETIAQYFMHQRIKPVAPDSEKWNDYVNKLTKAHAVMVAAMKCKQSVDAEKADALHSSILGFYEAYEGKKHK